MSKIKLSILLFLTVAIFSLFALVSKAQCGSQGCFPPGFNGSIPKGGGTIPIPLSGYTLSYFEKLPEGIDQNLLNLAKEQGLKIQDKVRNEPLLSDPQNNSLIGGMKDKMKPEEFAKKINEFLKKNVLPQTSPCPVLMPGMGLHHKDGKGMWGEKDVTTETSKNKDAYGNVPKTPINESEPNKTARTGGKISAPAGYEDDKSLEEAKKTIGMNLLDQIMIPKNKETAILESHVQSLIKASGGKVTADQIKLTTNEQLKEYFETGFYKPNEKSKISVRPSMYHVGQMYPSEKSNSKKPFTVETDCVFRDASPDEINKWQKGGGFGDNKGQGNNQWGPGGGNGGGGNGGGGSGGGLDALKNILPQLMQALGKGGQNQNQPQQGSSPTPYPGYNPSNNSYRCPRSSSDIEVCAEDGREYANRCVAEYEKQLTVLHEGECTEAEKAMKSSQFFEMFQEAIQGGVPESVLNSVLSLIARMVSDVFSGNSTPTTDI